MVNFRDLGLRPERRENERVKGRRAGGRQVRMWLGKAVVLLRAEVIVE